MAAQVQRCGALGLAAMLLGSRGGAPVRAAMHAGAALPLLALAGSLDTEAARAGAFALGCIAEDPGGLGALAGYGVVRTLASHARAPGTDVEIRRAAGCVADAGLMDGLCNWLSGSLIDWACVPRSYRYVLALVAAVPDLHGALMDEGGVEALTGARRGRGVT